MKVRKNKTRNSPVHKQILSMINDILEEFLPLLWNSEIIRDLLVVLTGKTRLEEIQELMRLSWREKIQEDSTDLFDFLRYCHILMLSLTITLQVSGIMKGELDEIFTEAESRTLN